MMLYTRLNRFTPQCDNKICYAVLPGNSLGNLLSLRAHYYTVLDNQCGNYITLQSRFTVKLWKMIIVISTWFYEWVYQLHVLLFHLVTSCCTFEGTHIHIKQQYLACHPTKQKLAICNMQYVHKYVNTLMYVDSTRTYAYSMLTCSMVVLRSYFQCVKPWETVVRIRPYFYRYIQLRYANFFASYHMLCSKLMQYFIFYILFYLQRIHKVNNNLNFIEMYKGMAEI